MLGYLMETAVDFIFERLPAILFVTLAATAARWLLIRRGVLHRRSVPHEAAVILIACYAAVVLSLTFLPLPFWRFLFSPSPSHYDFDSTLLAIWRGEYTAGQWVYTMLVGNVVMFIPFGFLVPIFWKLHWWQTLLLALGVILCIEVLQPFFDRGFDVDDIFLNFIGSAIGLMLSAVPRSLFPKLVAKVRE